jgi:hypothetical protein
LGSSAAAKAVASAAEPLSGLKTLTATSVPRQRAA